MKKRTPGIVMLALLFCLLALSASWAAGEAAPQKAPSFKLSNPKGEPVASQDFAGKVIYLDFWGSWCPPCIEEIPHLVSLYNTYREKGLVVVGVSLGDSKKALLQFMEKMKVTYPVVLGDDQIIQEYRGVMFLPTAFVIDRKGFIRRKLFGFREKEEIEQIILPLLEEK